MSSKHDKMCELQVIAVQAKKDGDIESECAVLMAMHVIRKSMSGASEDDMRYENDKDRTIQKMGRIIKNMLNAQTEILTISKTVTDEVMKELE